MLDSDKFKDFAENHTRKTGTFEGFSLKDIVSMTDNYSGDLLITQQQNRVVSKIANKRVHMRDVLTTLQGDPKYPSLSYAEVYDFDRNARYVTENGMLLNLALRLENISNYQASWYVFAHLKKNAAKPCLHPFIYLENVA